MTMKRTFRPRLLALLLLAGAANPPAAAQELMLSADPMVQARAAMARDDPAEALSRYLRVLSSRPDDVEALTGAGRAALEIGDPSAAIGFLARAEELAPRNGRVKAGLGSAMLQMENPKAALKFFREAEDAGVPAVEIASDRGLAYDLRGDNRRAQQEYAIAQRFRDDPENRRRLALSLAMTGDRAGALAVLDPLLRRQDVPAWRTRAFVLALTGDAAGAESGALSVMPRPQAEALIPFLVRLKALKPQQQAAAVHFGRFPSDGRRYNDAEQLAGATSRPDAGLIPSGTPLGRGGNAGVTTDEPVSTAPRRRPGSSEATPDASRREAALRQAESERMRAVAEAIRSLPRISPEPPANRAPASAAKPASEPGSLTLPPKTRLAQAAPPLSKPETRAAAKAKPEPKMTEAASKDPKAKDAKAKAEESAKARDLAKAEGPPERYWVQIAGGANKADLPKAYAKLKEKAPKLLAGRAAWTTPLRATNRLLIGPFKTSAEAQAFVNTAGKESFPAFAYISPAGTEVEKLPTR